MAPGLFVFFIFALSAAVFTGCEDTGEKPPQQQTQADEAPSGGGGSHTGAGGAGDVAIGAGAGDKTTIADRYKTALDMIKNRDWDGARAQLVEALNRSAGKEIQKDIRAHLSLVEQGILSEPVYSGNQVFLNVAKFLEKNVSIRGKLIPGGDVGKVTYYFWLASGKKIQCRYGNLSIDDKKKILSLDEGAQVLVRGVLKPPWGSNPNPYMDVTFFRLERLSPAQQVQQAEQAQQQQEGQP